MSSRRGRRIGLLLLVVAALAGAIVGVTASSAPGGEDAATLTKQLDQCRQNLAKARAALDTSESLAQLVAQKQIIFVPLGGVPVPVSVQQLEEIAFLRYAAGAISARTYARALAQVGVGLKVAKRTVASLVADATNERDKLENTCAALAQQLKQAQQGGQGPTGSSGPTESGTLVTISLNNSASITKNLKTGSLTPPIGSPGATIHLKSGSAYDGEVTVTGSLPANDTIYVIYHSQVWKVLPPTGGPFQVQEAAGFGAANDVDAAVCPAGGKQGDTSAPSPCVGGQTPDISIYWSP